MGIQLCVHISFSCWCHFVLSGIAECPPCDPHIQYIAKSTFSIDSSATITADTANELSDVDSFGSVEEVIKALLNFKDSRWALHGGNLNSNLNSKTLVLKDSSIRSIWTYLTASPCYTTNTNKLDNTTNKYHKHD